MKPLRLLFVTAALAAASAASAQSPPAPRPGTAANYADDRRWLCLPGRPGPCASAAETVELGPNGYGAKIRTVAAKEPPLDCFYVYPTVSSDGGTNSDLVSGREERRIAEVQAARFSSVCRVYAPLYRQMTLSTVVAYATGADASGSALLAYRDVAAAFRDFARRRAPERPFVLIGESQGSLMLIELIEREIEREPALARRMKLAILPGYDLLVPQGKLVGGNLKSTPLCSRPGQTRCAISWNPYRERNAPPPGAMFGYAKVPGMTVACVNPARWGSSGWEALDNIWDARSSLPVPGGPIRWSTSGAPSAPFVRTPGLASGRCLNQGQRGYLSIRTNADPKDKRTDRIGGEVGLFGMFLPAWGMHLSALALAAGDMVDAVATVSRTEGSK
ncbi:MAG: DUF3089 domain-containing protein [Sphingomicrobium sp.]